MEDPIPLESDVALNSEVLLQYAQRFAKSSDETVKLEDFDSRAFKWNVCGILDDEPALPQPERKVPSYFFHQIIPVSLPTQPPKLVNSDPEEKPKKASQIRNLDSPQSGPTKPLGYTSFPTSKTARFAGPPPGSAPKFMSGQVPSACRFGSAPKNLALRAPLPGAPPNLSLAPRQGKPAKGKGTQSSAKGTPKGSSKGTPIIPWNPAQFASGKGQGSERSAPLPRCVDLDERSPTICSHCHLPLGDVGYNEQGKGSVHGECMAQLLLQNLVDEEEERNQKDDEEKKTRREEYNIGWKIHRIPTNIGLQAHLKDFIISHGMCCLVLDENSRSVRLAATAEPSAAVNIEYLSIALQVRRKEGREPLFSLDPLNPKGAGEKFERHESQVKRFEPEWLAGTSAGEVLFQADYHLKELSMGEFEQPVVGMKSCFDYSEEEDSNNAWTARQWFMVRKAEVHLSEDGVVIPVVKMGVEAREQVLCRGAMIDAPITRKDHPMAKYAESFSKNFDLIAERKSVVYHLRELAKASVLAKFLVDARIQVEESWFNLAGEMEEACALEIPQLWNERLHSKIRVTDGELVDKRLGTSMHGIYGGVQFGLDRFKVDQAAPRQAMPATAGPGVARRGLLAGGVLARSGIPASVAAAPLSGGLSAMSTVPQMAAPLTSSLGAPPRDALAAGISAAMPMPVRMNGPSPMTPLSSVGVPKSLGAPLSLGAPKGVDLNLDQFSLDAPQQTADGKWVCEPQSENTALAMANAFWSCIDAEQGNIFEEEDLALLKSVFNPHLSDRRSEGACFAPPDTSIACVNKLRSLVKEEAEIRHARTNHFFSAAFKFDRAGPLFPSSWTSSYGIAGTTSSEHVLSQPCSLQARSDYCDEADEVLKSASPAFHKKTEDGMSFRIYRVGSLEVRTIQEHDGKETVGAVFSVRAEGHEQIAGGVVRSAAGREKIVKVTQYVHKVNSGAALKSKYSIDYYYYVVLETDQGSTILTRQMGDGTVTWEENLVDLEDRNSLAKVIRTANCQAGIMVQDMRAHRAQVLQSCTWDAKQGRRYATSAYAVALGGVEKVMKAAEDREREIKVREARTQE